MTPWRGKWALVTGASAGIGWELASQLAAGGANLVLTARRADRLAELAQDLSTRHNISGEVCVADLAHPNGPGEVFNFTQQRNIAVEVLVNNAGFGIYGEFREAPLPRLLEMVQVNVASVMHLTHLFIPQMVQRRSGYIMIVASTAAFQPVPYITAYAATKGFDLLFGEALAEEMREHGVRVSVLCPGSTKSEFHAVAGQLEHKGGEQETAEKVARVGLEALAAGNPRVISGWRNWLGMEGQRFAPRRLVTRVTAKMFKPGPAKPVRP